MNPANLVEFQCITCKGSGFCDHRVGADGISTAEAWGVTMKHCPDCNGAGVRVGLPPKHTEHEWSEYEGGAGTRWKRCAGCPLLERVS